MATKDASDILQQALEDHEFARQYGTQKIRHFEETYNKAQKELDASEKEFVKQYESSSSDPSKKELKALRKQYETVERNTKQLNFLQQSLTQAYVEHAETASLKVASRLRTGTTPERIKERVRSLSKDPDEISSLTEKYQGERYGDLNKIAAEKQKKINTLAEQLRRESQKQILDPALMNQLEKHEQQYLKQTQDKSLPEEIREAAAINLTNTRERIAKLKGRGFTTPQTLADRSKEIDAEMRELASIEHVKRQKEKTGGSPERVLEDAQAKLAKMEKREKRDAPAEEIELQKSRKALIDANQKYKNSVDELANVNKDDIKKTDEARQKVLKADEELEKAKKDNAAAEKREVEHKRERMAKWQTYMNIGQDIGGMASGLLGSIPLARAQLSQNIDVDLRNRQLQAQISMGNIANERTFEQLDVMTNARAYRRMVQNQAAAENRAGLEAGDLTSQNITKMIDAQVRGKLIDSGMNAITNTASGAIRGARSGNPYLAAIGGLFGFGSSITNTIGDPALVNLATQYKANLMGLPQSEEAVKRMELERQRNDVLNKVPDYAAQMALDLRMQAANATRGLGGNRAAAYRELTGEMGVYHAARVNLDQQQFINAAGVGRNVLGGDFNINDIYRGGQLAKTGVLGSAEQYLQMRGQLSNVGGTAADFEEILSRAVAAGLDNAKSITQMVDATTKMSDRSAKMGIDVTTGAAGILGRAAEALQGSGMAKSMIPGVAANTIEAYRNAIANKDLSLSNMWLAKQTSQRFRNASPVELANIQDLQPEQWGQLEALNHQKDKRAVRILANRLGVPSLVGDTGLTASAEAQKRDAITAANYSMSFQGIPDADPKVLQELQYIRTHGYDKKRLPPESRLFGQVSAYFKRAGIAIETMTPEVFTPSRTPGSTELTTMNEVNYQEQQGTIKKMMNADLKNAGDKALGTERQMADRGAQKMLDFDPNKVIQDTATAMGEKLSIPADVFGRSVTSFHDAVDKLNGILDTYIGGMKYNKTPGSLKNNVDPALEK